MAFDNFTPSRAIETAWLRLSRTGLRWPIELSSSIDGNYVVQHCEVLPGANWLTSGNVVLPQSPYTWSDTPR